MTFHPGSFCLFGRLGLNGTKNRRRRKCRCTISKLGSLGDPARGRAFVLQVNMRNRNDRDGLVRSIRDASNKSPGCRVVKTVETGGGGPGSGQREAW